MHPLPIAIFVNRLPVLIRFCRFQFHWLLRTERDYGSKFIFEVLEHPQSNALGALAFKSRVRSNRQMPAKSAHVPVAAFHLLHLLECSGLHAIGTSRHFLSVVHPRSPEVGISHENASVQMSLIPTKYPSKPLSIGRMLRFAIRSVCSVPYICASPYIQPHDIGVPSSCLFKHRSARKLHGDGSLRNQTDSRVKKEPSWPGILFSVRPNLSLPFPAITTATEGRSAILFFPACPAMKPAESSPPWNSCASNSIRYCTNLERQSARDIS
jgi:hypothetical protein